MKYDTRRLCIKVVVRSFCYRDPSQTLGMHKSVENVTHFRAVGWGGGDVGDASPPSLGKRSTFWGKNKVDMGMLTF